MSSSDQRTGQLDSFAAVSLVVGSILGSGIFIAPSLIASFSTSVSAAAILWLLGGLVCAIGAVIYGGLGLLYPQGGGQYVYLRESMGPRYSRFYGWVSMLVICPTMLAGTSLFFTELCKSVAPETASYAKLIAISLLVLFTVFNTFGLKLAGGVQKGLVVLHVALFLAIITVSVYVLPNHEFASYPRLPALGSLNLSKGILALAAVLWSFEGFNSVTFLTNEVKDGAKNIRKIAMAGCAIVLVLYLIFNVVVFANIPMQALPAQSNAASYLMAHSLGAGAGLIVFALTILGVATVLHSSVIIGPRVIAATINDGNVLPCLARTDRRTGTPIHALWFQCAVAVAYVLIGHFDALITAFIVLNWLFYGLTAIGFFRVRFQSYVRREISRAHVIGDFVCVAFFTFMVVALLLSQFMENPKLALAGLVIFVIGVYAKAPAFVKIKKAPPLAMPSEDLQLIRS